MPPTRETLPGGGKRWVKSRPVPGPIDFPPFRLEREPARLLRDGAVVALRPKVLAALCYLVDHRARAIGKEELLEAVWTGTTVGDAAVKVCIRELRGALRDDARRPAFVETLPGGRYRFVARVELEERAGATTERTVLVGRDSELATLAGLRDEALAGQRRVVLVRGDAGIGKTTLVDRFLEGATPAFEHGEGRAAVGRCDERHGATEPFQPFLEAIGRSCAAPGGRALVRLLRSHAPSWLLQLPGLLRADERLALVREYASATRDRMLRELVVGIEAITAEMPLLLALEDLHWADAGTIDLLLALARRRDPARLLLVATYRPDEATPISRAAAELRLRGFAHEIELGPLAIGDVDRLLALRLARRERAQKLAPSVHRHTGGHPLFLVHVVDELARAGDADPGDVCAAPHGPGLADVPPRLREIVTAQAERMSADDRRLLDAASVVGLEPSAAAVAAAVAEEVAEVEARLVAIGRVSRFLRPLPPAAGDAGDGDGLAARFAFTHGFHRDLLYESLTPAWRARLHARVGEFLERSRRGPIDRSPELAHHFERAGDAARAVRFLEVAAESAVVRHADHAAADYLVRALDLLVKLAPGDARDAVELRLRGMLGPALLNTRGFASPEVESCYQRSLELCAARGESAELFPVLEGLQSYFAIRGPLAQAHELSRRMADIARRTGDPLHRVEADHVMGCDLLKLGRLADARRHLERGVRRYDPALAHDAFRLCGHDPRVCCRAHLGLTLWFAGDPARALREASQAVVDAVELRQPMSVALARFTLAWVRLLDGAVAPARELLETTVALADDEGLPYWSGFARMFLGWALAERGDVDGAAEMLRVGSEVCGLVGPGIGEAEHAILGVRARLFAGEAALERLDAAEAILHARGERYLDAELDLLRAGALLGLDPAVRRTAAVERARRCLVRAVARARQLGAHASEARAAALLAGIDRTGSA